MYFYIRVLLLLCALAFVSRVNAADFSWQGFANGGYIGLFSSALAVCKSVDSASVTGSIKQFSPDGKTVYCNRTNLSDGVTSTSNRTGTLSGTSCPSGTTYNATTGACDAPPPDPCKDSTGTIDHQHQVGNLDGTGSRAEPPATICENSCQYSFDYQITACYRYADGTHLNGAFCKYKYKGSGVSCTNGPATPPGSLFDQPPTKAPIPLDPTLTKDIQCSDWVTNADGTGSRSCSNVSEYKDPGKINCPEGTSGTVVCSPGTPSPAYTKTDITETTTTKTNPDGSKDNTTTKTTDKTVCFGVKPCTSTTATEVKTDGTNADGTSKDDAKGSTCTGSGCKDVDKDPSKDDPSKDPEEDEEEPRVATGGGSCDAAPSCSGDAIDCAVLAEQHKARCNAEEAGDFPKHKGEIEGLLAGDKFKLNADEEISAGSFVSSGARFLPSTCPADTNFSLAFAGGHSYALSYSPFCFFAESISPLIVIAATVFAALYVGRAFGGE